VNRPRLLAPFLTILFLALGAVAPPAGAQCVTDGLDSQPCCTPVNAVLPVFPAINDSSKYVCFKDCSPQIDQNLQVMINAPVPVNSGGIICGLYLIKFTVKTGGGQTLWTGNLRAHYSRNWQEIDATGQTIGVWRLLLNGDFRPSTFLLGQSQASNPCVVPPCRASFNNRVYVAGYIDYAFDCTNLTWNAAWAFGHECDVIHHPLGSPRPAPAGGFHPTRSYTWLGPGTTFVVDPITTPTAVGNVVQDNVRWNDWASLPNICLGEEQVGGQMTILNQTCPCNPNPGALPQYDETDLRLMGACGTSAVTILPAIVPLLQKRIGSWTNPSVFPGQEFLCLVSGDIDYGNGCNLLSSTEFFEGVTTIGGNFAIGYTGTVLERQFVDLASSNRNPNNLARRVGVAHISQYIMNLNVQ